MTLQGIQTYFIIGLIVSLSWTRYTDIACAPRVLPHVMIGAAVAWPVVLAMQITGVKPSCAAAVKGVAA